MKVISLINMKGGVGKTTLAVNICDCLARRNNKRVLLIDVDPQFNATQLVLTGEKYVQHLKDKKDTVFDIFDKSTKTVVSTTEGISEEHNKKLSDIKPIKIKDNFFLLPGNLEISLLEMSPGAGKEHRLFKYLHDIGAESKYDYIIIDTPPTPSIWLTSALLASDYYLIPVKPEPLSMTGIDLLQNIIDEKKENYSLNIKCAGLVFTMVEKKHTVYQKSIHYLTVGAGASKWKTYLYKKDIPRRTAIARDQTNQIMILDQKDTESKAALVSIVAELTKRIND